MERRCAEGHLSNGQVVATGEAYETKAAAKDGCEGYSVLPTAPRS
ncbi:YegP family protein [Actinoplanes sp. NPDC051513]